MQVLLGFILAGAALRVVRSPWSVVFLAALVVVALVPAVRARAGRAWVRIEPLLGPWRLFAAALVLRVLWVILSGVEQTSDFAHYDQLGWAAAQGGSWVQTHTQSGAAIFIGLHYLLAGHHPLLPQLSLALLGALHVPLLFHAGVRMEGRSLGVLAGLLLAFWPESVLYSNLLGTDILFSFLVLLGQAALWRGVGFQPAAAGTGGPGPRKGLWFAFLGGLALGASQWARPYGFILGALALLWVIFGGAAPRRARLRVAGAAASGMLILLVPLIAAYWQRLGIPTLTPQHGGASLYVGANRETHGGWNSADIHRIADATRAEPDRPGEHPDRKRNRVARGLAQERVRANGVAGQFHLMVWEKVPRFWGQPADITWSVRPSRFEAHEGAIYRAARRYHILLVLLAGGALIAFIPASPAHDLRCLFILQALTLTALHAVYECQPRYHHFLLPALALIAGEAIHRYLLGLGPHKAADDTPAV